MATIDIKRAAATILSPQIDDSSRRRKVLNGEDYVELNFSHNSFVEILIGDYITWDGTTYTVKEIPEFTKVSKREYQYSIRFEGPYIDLESVIFKIEDEGEFPLTGRAEDFIDHIVTNLNAVYGAGTYVKGTVDTTEYKTLEFSNESCLNVLQRLCEEYDLEYSLTGSININLVSSVGTATGLTFEYHQGLRHITRRKVGDKNIITRLYAYGSEKNLNFNYGSKRIHLPSATYPNKYMDSGTGTYGIREAVKFFEEIFPHFTGTATDVAANRITDTSINFDLNSYLLEGTAAKIVFLSGDLAGMEMEISSYNNSTKQVTYKTYVDEFGQEWPDAVLKPAIGDEFTFVDISMPAAYISAAEAQLATKAMEYLNQMSAPNVEYDVESDWHDYQKRGISLDVGDIVLISDPELAAGGIEFRILELSQSIANYYKYDITIGEQILVSYLSRRSREREKLKRTVQLNRRVSTVDIRRNYASIDELQGSIFDTDGYFDPVKIKPLSIETSMLSVGNKTTQLVLIGVLAQPNYQGNVNYLRLTGGSVIHFSIESSPKTWTIPTYTITTLTSGSAYYIYTKCNKSNTTATWLVTTDQYQVDPDDGYYYFLVGLLSSVDTTEGVRLISWLYGQTAINGGFIKTGRVESLDGETYIDLDSGESKLGNSEFRSAVGNDAVEISGQSIKILDSGDPMIDLNMFSGKAGGELRVYNLSGGFMCFNPLGIERNGAAGITHNAMIAFYDVEGIKFNEGVDFDKPVMFFDTVYLTLAPGAKDYKVVCDAGGSVVTYEADTSDRRLKRNLKKIRGAMGKVRQLQGYTFYFTEKGAKITGKDANIRRAGLLAQDVLKVFPEPVRKLGESGYMRLEYDELVALLVEAVKEADSEIGSLKSELLGLKRRVEKLEKLLDK